MKEHSSEEFLSEQIHYYNERAPVFEVSDRQRFIRWVTFYGFWKHHFFMEERQPLTSETSNRGFSYQMSTKWTHSSV